MRSASVDSVDQFHDEGLHAVGIFEAVDLRDVRMIERRQNLCFALEAGEAIGIGGERRAAGL